MSDIEKFNSDIATRNAALDAISGRIAAATSEDDVIAAARDLGPELELAKALARRHSQWAKQVMPLISRNGIVYNEGTRRLERLLNG